MLFFIFKSVIMKSTAILFLALVGVGTAFVFLPRPAVPFQVESSVNFAIRGGDFVDSQDSGLDNPAITEDKSISPAKKCGFCFG